MKSVLLIGATSDSPKARALPEFRDRLRTALGIRKLRASINICHYDEISFDLAPGTFAAYDHHNDRQLSAYSLVLFKGETQQHTLVPYMLSRYLRLHDIPHFNDYVGYRPINKLPQLVDMCELNLRFPRTLYSPDKELLCRLAAEQFTFPVIVKAAGGSQGRHNFRVNDKAELRRALAEAPDTEFIVEGYIPNHGDYRILVLGDREVVLFRQGRKGTHLNNSSQGGTIEAVPRTRLPQFILGQAHALAASLDMQSAGVDVIRREDSDEYYFLEINSQPRWNPAGLDELGDLVGKYLG